MREKIRELTPLTIILGVLIGCVMGAANAYVGLKFGLTISASIPAAVISMGILRGILRRGTLLENNMVQTIGSAGESLAAGVIFTVPALFILNEEYKEVDLIPSYWRIALFGVLGGVLGILMMIPLRRYLIVKEHDNLPYPEGTACAEVLKSGQSGGSGALLVFGGLFIGFVHKLLEALFKFWHETITVPVKSKALEFNMKTNVAMDASAVLLGVGYILGLRVSAIMVSGGLVAWLIVIPLIAYFGSGLDTPFPPSTKIISAMAPGEMWNNYIRYVGAGGVVFGGVVSLMRAFPAIASSVWFAIVQLFKGRDATEAREDRDLPIWVVLVGSLAIIVAVYAMNMNSEAGWPVAIATAIAGFVFVAVASRIVGLVGSTSSPVSGMTIATLMATALIFRAMGMTGADVMGALIGVGAVVCIAIAMAGDCSQDLKTGFLVGATPSRQQIGEIIGVLTSAVTCAGILILLNDSAGFLPVTPEEIAALPEGATPRKPLLAPQANVIKMVVSGIDQQNLPWELIFIGAACAFVAECLAVPSLPFAVGLYLPLSVTSPIFAGGLLHWLVAGRKKDQRATHAGVLGSSGLVAGGALMGLGMAGLSYFELSKKQWWIDFMERVQTTPYIADVMHWWKPNDGTEIGEWRGWVVSFVPFLLLMLWLSFISWRNRTRGDQLPPPTDTDDRPPPPSTEVPPGPTASPVQPQPPAPQPPAPVSPAPAAPAPDPYVQKPPVYEPQPPRAPESPSSPAPRRPDPGPLAPKEDWFTSGSPQQPPTPKPSPPTQEPPSSSFSSTIGVPHAPEEQKPPRPDESTYILGSAHPTGEPTKWSDQSQPTGQKPPESTWDRPPDATDPPEKPTDTLGLLDELGPPPTKPEEDKPADDEEDKPSRPPFDF